MSFTGVALWCLLKDWMCRTGSFFSFVLGDVSLFLLFKYIRRNS